MVAPPLPFASTLTVIIGRQIFSSPEAARRYLVLDSPTLIYEPTFELLQPGR